MKDTISFIEKVVEEACHIFGHSNGGWIGLWVAAKRPDLVNSLIVGDSGLDTAKLIEEGKSEEERAFNQRFMDWAGKPVEELVEIFSNRYSDSRVEYIETRALTFSQVDPRVYIDWVDGRLDKYFKGYQYEEILGSIKCPVLVLKAENGMISQEEVKRAQKINDEIMIKEMDGYDHWLGIQDGRESALLNEVINFLFPFT
jgi:pimeloyl-ACP methyl ester carboxylesterase